MKCPLRDSAIRYPSHVAIVDHVTSVHLTYAQFDASVEQTKNRLMSAGVRSGDRVALNLPAGLETTWHYPVLLYSLIRIGALACPLNPRLPSQAITQYAESVGCTKIITTAIAHEFAAFSTTHQGALIELEIKDDQPAIAIFTSGTTSEPKAVLLSFGNLYYSALGSNLNIPLIPGDRWLLSLPLFHVSGIGILFRCLVTGAIMVLGGEMKDVTHLSLVVTQLARLLKAGENKSLSSIKAILLGGSAIPDSLIEQGLRLGLPLYKSYGLSEMASQVTTTLTNDLGPSSGKLLKYRELKISDQGEILVKGDTLFLGYLTRNGFTRHLTRLVDDSGWFATGDLGHLDKMGCLTVLGRKDHMFISGGENIHPEEIEAAILRIAGVIEAVVVPVEDQEFGVRPVAFVRMERSDSRLTPPDIRRELEKTLPRFKIPVAFLDWPTESQEFRAGVKLDRRKFQHLATRI